MSAAYVDTSCIVAVAFGEASASAIARRMSRFDRLFSSPLLEAELFSAFVREGREMTDAWSSTIEMILADRPLSAEVVRVLEAGYLRVADCWHLATALYLAPDPADLAFLTLDAGQRRIARALGFTV